MDRNTPRDGAPAAVRAETFAGRAAFERTSPTAATLELEYQVPARNIDLTRGSLREGIQALCAAEIGQMQGTLHSLGTQLAGQLSEAGRTPVVSRHWSSDEERTWRNSGGSFHVEATRTRLSDRLSGYQGAADARLVRASVRLMIEQRAENIHDIYQKVLTEAEGQRQQPAGDRSPHS